MEFEIGPIRTDIEEEEMWCDARRAQVVEYLSLQDLTYGAVGDVPAWRVFPYVSLWAVESGAYPGQVGWWVICGDCPTDYVTCEGERTPRSAVRAFAARWLEAADFLEKGEQHPDFQVGEPEEARSLAPMLRARAKVLASARGRHYFSGT